MAGRGGAAARTARRSVPCRKAVCRRVGGSAGRPVAGTRRTTKGPADLDQERSTWPTWAAWPSSSTTTTGVGFDDARAPRTDSAHLVPGNGQLLRMTRKTAPLRRSYDNSCIIVSPDRPRRAPTEPQPSAAAELDADPPGTTAHVPANISGASPDHGVSNRHRDCPHWIRDLVRLEVKPTA